MTNPDAYDDDSENRCPICKNADPAKLDVHDIIQDDAKFIFKKFTCLNCSAKGRETHSLNYIKMEVI